MPRIVDMSTSHTEYFYPNTPPEKITLSSPKTNSFLNDTTPTLTWLKGNDTDGDTLSYLVQVDESGGDWSTLVDSTLTNPGELTWDVSNTLSDDSAYQWRVRGNDTLQNSTWSDTWIFTIDSDQLVANKPQIHGPYNTTGTVRWIWTRTPDSGSGIVGYHVYIGSTVDSNDVVNDEVTTNNWYEMTSLPDGNYYCRVRVENGAGTLSPFSPSSDVILVDKEKPNINKPLAWDVFNNTGTVRWSWGPSFDTGSGLVGYYVYIGTSQDGNDIVDGEFTSVNRYELSGLLDGVTYYCRIKALNGAGTTSDFSPSSDGVLIDLDVPVANVPVSHGKYNNTGKIRWSWEPAVDTGSGIAGYFVTISRDSSAGSSRGPTENIVISNAWTSEPWYEADGLQNGYIFFCHIKARNRAGSVGEFSDDGVGVIVDTKAPGTPVGLVSTPGTWSATDLFTLSWTNPKDVSGIAGVYYKLDSTPKNDEDGLLITGQGIGEISDIPLKTDGEHFVYVWLKDNAGNVEFLNSASVSLYLDTTAPGAPISAKVKPDDWSSVNSFEIDWSEPIDLSGVKTGVYYKLGSTPPTSEAGSTWTDQKPLSITTASEGVNNVYLWLEDFAGNSDFNNYGTVDFKMDITPPTITHTPISRIYLGKDVDISAQVTDVTSGISDVTLYYKAPDQSEYNTRKMSLQSGTSKYLATIPQERIAANGFEYYIKAADNSIPRNEIFYSSMGESDILPDSDSDLDVKVIILPRINLKTPSGAGISIYTKINVSFSKQMDTALVPNAFRITPSVSGMFIWTGDGKQMTFTPNENLSYDTEYTIRISDAAKDLDGYPLDKNYTWTFTTEYEPEVDVPENGDEEDLTMVYVGVVVVVIVVILLIVVFMVLSKKKKREEEAKKKKEEEEAKKASLKPKLEFIVSDQKTSAMVCPECGASIPEADRCKYCGWHRHM
jgi:hypothetical protein